jgi:hypothetical protein
MDFNKATKKQLLQIVLDEQCPIVYKFQAVNEYKKRDLRGFKKVMLQAKIVRNKA